MPTATAHWPTSNVRLFLFVLRGVLISLGAFGLLRIGWVETHAMLPFTLAQAALAIRIFGVPALPIDVTLACSGADAISLSLGAILAFPATWRRRVAGAAGAMAMIVAINVLRIGTLGRAAGTPTWFDPLHLYVWPAVLTLAIAAYVLVWMGVSSPASVARSTTSITGATPLDAAAPPRMSRRFMALAGIFLLVFIAAAPLYLHSATVLSIAAFIARCAAAILTAAGIQAFAAGNVLWSSHGAFLVTEECISTPLIPVYLAAVTAYARSWKRLTIGLLTAVPLFVALGVMRLLVVALPQSVGTQSFFIHAFYQLLAGVVIVFSAAFWRHRDATTLAWGISGIGVGTLFVAVSSGTYLAILTAAAGAPPVDPQGAIAFLPAFQTGLYFALWVAAFPPPSHAIGWTRFAVGLALLVAAQLAGFVALNAVMTHSAMTMAVRDVRGWALAAPVLVFAAVVSVGRPRR